MPGSSRPEVGFRWQLEAGGTTAQKQAAGRKGGKATAAKS
jgi:hypothetical protein